MKRFFLTTLTAFLFVPLLIAQTVDSIKVEQAGELIKIHYKILIQTSTRPLRSLFPPKLTVALNLSSKALLAMSEKILLEGNPDI